MVNFINRVIMLCLALPLLATVFSDSVEEYHFRYLSNMEDGLKCHEGFKTLSPYVKNAADLCAKEKIMASFLVCIVYIINFYLCNRHLHKDPVLIVIVRCAYVSSPNGDNVFNRMVITFARMGQIVTD